MSHRLTFLFAVAAGAAIGNLYWAQPILGFIAGDLRAPVATAGWLVTATQLGYAAGLLLLVPLGDVLDRRRFVPMLLLASAAALLLCALAPSIGVLLLTLGVLGVTTVSGQVLAPLAGDLAGDARRGRVVATIGSGTLTGILAARTISGFVAGTAGWRTIFALAAVVAVLLAVLLYRAIPPLAPRTRMPYPALIVSVAAVVVRERAARWTLVLAALGFAAFTLLWTALTFLLSGPPFRYPAPVIGLFGLAGLAGVLAVRHAGRLHDHGRSLPATGAAWLLALGAFVCAAFVGRSVMLLVIVIIVIDVALQGQALLNRARLFAISDEARSRLNTALGTGNFLGGAAGSAAATVLWSAGGWTAVTIAGASLCCCALTVWALGRRGPLVVRSAMPDQAVPARSFTGRRGGGDSGRVATMGVTMGSANDG